MPTLYGTSVQNKTSKTKLIEEAAHNIPGTPGRTFDIEDIFVLAYFS